MPRYQYACPDCGNQFEAQQKFIDKPLKKCPTCGKRNLYRVVGLVAVAFKGTGFYVNDSKSGSTGKTAVKAEGEETKVEASADAEAKPEATTEAKPEVKAENGAEPTTKPAEKAPAETKTESASAPSKAESKPATDKKSKRKS